MIYSCNECPFQTTTKRSWENHKANHEKQREVESLLTELPSHLSLNKSQQLKEFYCKQCNAGFVLEKGLKDHLQSTNPTRSLSS